jgi:hypothetical protein
MELKYKIESVIRVDYSDLDEFLTERFDLPEDYEFAAMEELGNDIVKSINVDKDDLDEYDREYVVAVVKDKKPKSYGTRIILCYLCNLGEIPEGEYLINVSW